MIRAARLIHRLWIVSTEPVDKPVDNSAVSG